MRTYRSVSVAAFAIALSALVGGFFGGRVLATQDGLPERINVFTTALKQIEQKYVEPVESDRVVYSAINGMLQTLDPHSSFMDPKAYAQLRERQEGHYYGLGITHQRARRRYHRHGAVRGIARLQEGHPPRRRHRQDQRRGRQRMDERAGGAEAARAARHPRAGVDPPHRLRQADRRRGRARRNQDSERPVGVHD